MPVPRVLAVVARKGAARALVPVPRVGDERLGAVLGVGRRRREAGGRDDAPGKRQRRQRQVQQDGVLAQHAGGDELVSGRRLAIVDDVLAGEGKVSTG